MELKDCNSLDDAITWAKMAHDGGHPSWIHELAHQCWYIGVELGKQSRALPVIDMAAIKEETYIDQHWRPMTGMPEYLRNDAGQLRKERRSEVRGEKPRGEAALADVLREVD